MEQVLFSERQYFRQIWIWILMVFLTALMVWGLISQLILDKPIGNNPGPDWFLFLSLLLVLAIDVLLFSTYLEVKIYKKRIEYRFYPFISWKCLRWDEVEQAYVRKYRPIGEFGGWGIRIQPGRRSRALNVSGNIGLQLVMKNGAKLLIGTRNGNAMESALASTDGPYADVEWPGKEKD